MTRFLAVFRKEFLLISRRPALYIQLLIVPTVLVLLISFAFENLLGSPKRLPLPVIDLDQSADSRYLSNALQSTGYLKVLTETPSTSDFAESDAIQRFERGRRPTVLVVPKGYQDDFRAGRPAQLTLYSDPAQPSPAFLTRTAIQTVLDQLSFTEAGVRLALAEGTSTESAIRNSVGADVADFVNSPPLKPQLVLSAKGRGLPSPFEQTVPAFTMWFSGIISSYIYFIMLQERREWGVASRIAIAGGSRWAHFFGKASVAYIFGIGQFVVMMGAAHFAFGMELGSIASLIPVVAAFLLIPIAIGVIVAGVSKTVVAADSMFSAWVNVAPILGGLLVPVFLLPRFLGTIAKLSPYYWSLAAMQEVTVRGGTLGDVWLKLLIIVTFAGVILAIGLPRFTYSIRDQR